MGYDASVAVVFGVCINPDSDTAQRVFDLIYGEDSLRVVDSDSEGELEEYWGDRTDMDQHNHGYYFFLNQNGKDTVCWLTCCLHEHSILNKREGPKGMYMPTENEKDNIYIWLEDNKIDYSNIGWYTFVLD